METLTKCSKVCDLIGEGLSVVTACKEVDLSPRTFWANLAKSDDLMRNYTRAREARADSRAESIDELVQATLNGEVDPNAARVALDARKWLAARESPKRYGDKVHQEITGANAGPLVVRWEE